MLKYFKIMLLLLVISIQNYSQTNLLQNPGFEEFADTVFTGWRLAAWGGASADIYDETGNNVITGNISAKVVVDTIGDKIEKVHLKSYAVTNVPEGELIITVFARTETQENLPFRISAKCQGIDGSRKYLGGEEVLLTTAAQKFSFAFNPAIEIRDSIFVRLACGSSLGTYIFDDVVLSSNTAASLPIPTGRRLREIVADKYPDGNVFIGGAISNGYWDTFSEEILNNEYSYITPVNDFKQPAIHPEPGGYDWSDSDTWVQKAKDNNQVIRMHSPISPQCSKWAKDDSRTGEELLQNLEEYVTALCQRYNNEEIILWMDVVNETIDKTTGEWMGPKPGVDSWENPWTIIGFDTTDDGLNPPLYINRAFELANEHAPNIKQIVNQHGTMNDAAWDKVKALVSYLRGKGRRVDGIGFQGHIDVGWEKENNDNGVNNIVALGELIDWVHANNLEFHVTENNVWLRNGNESKTVEQGETFAAVVKMIVSKRTTGVVSWNAWNMRNGDGKHGDRLPTLFNEDGSAKPAYYAVQSVLEDTVTTGIKKNDVIPNGFELYNNYPNPFNPTTQISFSIPETNFITLKIFNVLGVEVKTLLSEKISAGSYDVEFDAQNLSSGVYFYSLRGENITITKKMLLQK